MAARIVMHTSEPESGAALYVANLVNALSAAGATVVLFCPPNFAYADEIRSAGASVACSARRDTTGGASLAGRLSRNLRFFAAAAARQALLTRSGDIVHFHFPLYFPAGLALFLLARLQARAVVFTAHDPSPHKWLWPSAFRPAERGCLRWAYSMSTLIVVHNHRAKELIAASFGQKPSKIVVVPHGCATRSPDQIRPCASPVLELLMFGSIRENKGVDLAIAAVRLINEAGPKVRLTIAGAVANARERHYWNSCKSAIGPNEEGFCVMERFIPDHEVPALLERCHAVLLPYRNFESESGVAAVALAHGRPILATGEGGFAELLAHGDFGVPISSPTANCVEAAIREALSRGSSELARMGLRGLAWAQAERSWEAIGKQTRGLYREIESRR